MTRDIEDWSSVSASCSDGDLSTGDKVTGFWVGSGDPMGLWAKREGLTRET